MVVAAYGVARMGKTASERNSAVRTMVASTAKVRPLNSSVTFSCNMVYPMTQATPAPAPIGTVKNAAQPIAGIAASTKRQQADASSATPIHRSRSSRFDRYPARPMPAPIPMPRAVIRMPNPAVAAPSEYWAKAGPTDITEPAPAKAMTTPTVRVLTSACSRRNRMPSRMSARADLADSPSASAERGRRPRFRSSPHTIQAENRKVSPSSHRASDQG